MPIPPCLVVEYYKKPSGGNPTTLFFFKIVLAFIGSLHFHETFGISLSISRKKTKWDFNWDCFESIELILKFYRFYRTIEIIFNYGNKYLLK